MPTFNFLSGIKYPGQFGPISLVFLPLRYSLTFTISETGIPSVTHTIIGILASICSIIASAAKGAGTKINPISGEVFLQPQRHFQI